MNGNGSGEVKTPATPSSAAGGRPVYATASTLFTPDPSVGHLLYTMRKVGPKVPPEVVEAAEDIDQDEAEEDYEFLEQLLQSRELNALVKAHNVILFCNQEQCPCVSNACQITADVMEDIRPFALMMEECRELYALLSAPHVRNLLASHDIVAQRDYMPKLSEIPIEVDEDEETIKIVQLVKSSDPTGQHKSSEPIVGATIKAEEETGRILIARVMHGGAADRSGLISVGDEVIEVNGVNVEGQTPNDVLKILQMAENTITFKLIPNMNKPLIRESRVRLRALFDYDPVGDKYIPCKEAGLSFHKGDILHIVSQDDPYWWQARREQDRNMRAGLIPSRALQERRIVHERNELNGDTANLTSDKAEEFCDPLGLGGCAPGFAGGQNGLTTYPLGGCLPVGPGGAGGAPGGAVFDPYAPIQKMTTGCVSGIDAADSYLTSGGNGNKTKKVMYDLLDNEEFDREEIPTYEEVARLFPRPGVFRPIVLIGPPGVGRNELKRRLMALESERYKATIPHTSRASRPGEIHGKDYFFDTREQMEIDIAAGKFIEHGEYRANVYGTSVDGIRDFVLAGYQPIISPHYQALKMLRTPELKPYIINIKAPPFERLKETRHRAYARSTFDETSSRSFTDDEFDTMIKAGEKIERLYAHWFDMVIENEDLNSAFEQLVKAVRRLDQDAQWVPVSWVQ